VYIFDNMTVYIWNVHMVFHLWFSPFFSPGADTIVKSLMGISLSQLCVESCLLLYLHCKGAMLIPSYVRILLVSCHWHTTCCCVVWNSNNLWFIIIFKLILNISASNSKKRLNVSLIVSPKFGILCWSVSEKAKCELASI
jgi:hypothetical protein